MYRIELVEYNEVSFRIVQYIKPENRDCFLYVEYNTFAPAILYNNENIKGYCPMGNTLLSTILNIVLFNYQLASCIKVIIINMYEICTFCQIGNIDSFYQRTFAIDAFVFNCTSVYIH